MCFRFPVWSSTWCRFCEWIFWGRWRSPPQGVVYSGEPAINPRGNSSGHFVIYLNRSFVKSGLIIRDTAPVLIVSNTLCFIWTVSRLPPHFSRFLKAVMLERLVNLSVSGFWAVLKWPNQVLLIWALLWFLKQCRSLWHNRTMTPNTHIKCCLNGYVCLPWSLWNGPDINF